MSEKTLKTRIRHAVKKESEWASLNPVLLPGEIAYNSDNDKYKIGNGTSTWSQLSYKIPVTKSSIGLGNVENKSSATIRSELTKANVTNALGYTPPTTNTTYGVATSSALGLVKSGTDITVNSSGNVTVNDDSHNHIISNVDGLQGALDTKATKTTLTNQDLNSVITPGFYNAGGGNTVTNKPSDVEHFGLIVIHRASGSYYTQILFDDTSSYRRFCVNGNWGKWTQDKLTDTDTWRGIQNNLTSDSTTDSLSAAQGKVLKSLVDAKSASGHTHDDRYYTESETNTKLNAKLNTSLKGAANGLAELDSTGRVPSNQLPSYIDDVIEGYLYNSKFYKESSHTTQITGETGKIYVDLTSNKTYRWSGSAFVVISETLALGETSATAYRGDRGKIAYDHSQVAHAPSNAEVNQNAFSNVKIGSTTIVADSKTDTLTLVAGNNVTLTPDATNDKITISSTNTTYSAGTGISLSGTTFNNSGVRSISTGGTNGTISVNTNGTSAEVAVKGLGSAAYTASSAYATSGHTHNNISAIDITGKTVDINTYNLSSGSPYTQLYIEKTNGGASNITNIPITANPFRLYVDLLRWVSASDYITKQTFVSSNAKSVYERWCTNGTWTSWMPISRFTSSPTSGQVLISDGTAGGIKTSGCTIGKSVPSNAVFTDTVYTHPTTAGNKHIPSGGSPGKILRWSSDGTAVWGDESNSDNTGATTVTPTETSWYTGKKIVCYGTSITEQGQTVSNWISNLVNKLICKIDNQGHGGCRVVNYQQGDLSTMTMLQNLPTNGDVNIFEGGVNDWRSLNIKVNSSGSGFMSFKDALRRIADYYLTNMPQAINLWITPHYCLTVVDGTATDTVGGESLEDYANAMIEVAEEYGIPCVDLYHNCGWRSKNISTFVNNENGAYIHPNAKGGARMYSLILNKLKELEPTIDYKVEGSSSSGGSSGDSNDNKLSSEVVLTPLKIGITEKGVFTNYTNSTSGEIIKISDTNYKLNLTAGSEKYLAIETGNTTNNLRLAVKKISSSLNATLYNATSLTSTNGTINTLADAYGNIQTPLACNNGTGIILVSVYQDLNAECYIYIGNNYTSTSTTDEEKEKIVNTFFT